MKKILALSLALTSSSVFAIPFNLNYGDDINGLNSSKWGKPKNITPQYLTSAKNGYSPTYCDLDTINSGDIDYPQTFSPSFYGDINNGDLSQFITIPDYKTYLSRDLEYYIDQQYPRSLPQNKEKNRIAKLVVQSKEYRDYVDFSKTVEETHPRIKVHLYEFGENRRCITTAGNQIIQVSITASGYRSSFDKIYNDVKSKYKVKSKTVYKAYPARDYDKERLFYYEELILESPIENEVITATKILRTYKPSFFDKIEEKSLDSQSIVYTNVAMYEDFLANRKEVSKQYNDTVGKTLQEKIKSYFKSLDNKSNEDLDTF
ncbi:hypothetical protein NB550_13145 [Vibrio parahaemolyticus]|uniref:hypothetical protein n=1 Tax=Vibrio parahaemolyticus TaxID=670 RepID=UPI00215BDD03|nr:hypothetical protein [Vibrio parahaemolyticus]EKH9208449.1 hypothetical protein [Vibrio parahaemolyticus]MCR9887004.1 hypothetical protein [Vibrio parahaemolyticus]MCR9918441.1 hypothetical protein [Vibrio parahaemolyticus]